MRVFKLSSRGQVLQWFSSSLKAREFLGFIIRAPNVVRNPCVCSFRDSDMKREREKRGKRPRPPVESFHLLPFCQIFFFFFHGSHVRELSIESIVQWCVRKENEWKWHENLEQRASERCLYTIQCEEHVDLESSSHISNSPSIWPADWFKCRDLKMVYIYN